MIISVDRHSILDNVGPLVRWSVGPSHCEDDLSKHENTHDNAVIHYDNSNHDDPVNHDDSAKHDNHYYHPKASEFMWKCMYSLMNENLKIHTKSTKMIKMVNLKISKSVS